MLETEDTAVVYSAQQPWSEAGPGAEAGKALSVLETEDTAVVYSAQQPWSECPKYNNIISYLRGRHCLCWRLRILLWYTLPNNHGLRLGLGLRLGRSALSITP